MFSVSELLLNWMLINMIKDDVSSLIIGLSGEATAGTLGRCGGSTKWWDR